MDHQRTNIKRLLVTLVLVLSATAASRAVAISSAPEAVMADVNRSLTGDNICANCHAAQMTIYQTKHGVKADARTPGCQSCHGESAAHRGDPNKNSPDVVFVGKSKNASLVEKRNGACLTCHESNVLPRPYWSGSQHERRGVACTDCHEIHNPNPRVFNKLTQPELCFGCHKTQRAQVHRFSRHPILEGKVTCSSCHNPHGSPGPTLLVKNSVNETCYTCHAEKRGPFLWEHAPVVDDCTNCHTPHGSNLSPLLKTRAPMLCQSCHTGDHGKNLYSGANLPSGNVTTGGGRIALGSQSPPAQGNSRSCLSCHSVIHGSNHPAGAKFQR
jgi:DmsE family decaheme c-type cytochrome